MALCLVVCPVPRITPQDVQRRTSTPPCSPLCVCGGEGSFPGAGLGVRTRMTSRALKSCGGRLWGAICRVLRGKSH